ncbi:MAG TPA: glutamate 5-kinase [Chthoniobacterales bacterium]|jgi:glutamate 5-kinase
MASRKKRIILKFGTGILARADGMALDSAQIKALTGEIAALVLAGHEVCVVSSGAVAAGLAPLGFTERPTDLPSIQACAAVGQSRLMQAYESLFTKHNLHVGQLLLTHQDIDSRARYTNARNTLDRLFSCRNVVPIINENDSVAVEELRFGDNDRLSAEVAILAGADLLILLTSVDGLLNEKTGKVIPLVSNLSSAEEFVRDEKGRFSVGGMKSKLQAAARAASTGIKVVIANGRKPEGIRQIVAGAKIGTRVTST